MDPQNQKDEVSAVMSELRIFQDLFFPTPDDPEDPSVVGNNGNN